jgi:hypothetical protein
LRLWNSENGKVIGVAEYDVSQLAMLNDEQHVVSTLVVSEDGSLVATGRGWGDVQLRNGNSLSLIDTVNAVFWIQSVVLSRDLLAVGCNSTVKLYDLQSHAFVAELPSIPDPLSLSFSPDCTRLAACRSGVLQLWDVPRLKASFSQSDVKSASVTALAFSADGS